MEPTCLFLLSLVAIYAKSKRLQKTHKSINKMITLDTHNVDDDGRG